MKYFARLLVPVALLFGSATLVSFAGDADAQLIGASSSGLRVLIRKVDEGPILWDAPLKPATKASLSAGEHKISVMCEVHKSGSQMMLPGSVTLTVEAGRIYDLSGDADTAKLRCTVTAKERP